MIGVRFTQKERRIIESIAEYRDKNLTEFLRTAVFTHIRNLSRKVPIDLSAIRSDIEDVEGSAQEVLYHIQKIKERLEPILDQKSPRGFDLI